MYENSKRTEQEAGSSSLVFSPDSEAQSQWWLCSVPAIPKLVFRSALKRPLQPSLKVAGFNFGQLVHRLRSHLTVNYISNVSWFPVLRNSFLSKINTSICKGWGQLIWYKRLCFQEHFSSIKWDTVIDWEELMNDFPVAFLSLSHFLCQICASQKRSLLTRIKSHCKWQLHFLDFISVSSQPAKVATL